MEREWNNIESECIQFLTVKLKDFKGCWLAKEQKSWTCPPFVVIFFASICSDFLLVRVSSKCLFDLLAGGYSQTCP